MGYGSFTLRGGGQKVQYVPRNEGNQTSWGDAPGFCWDIQAVPQKFEKKRVCVQFLAPKRGVLAKVVSTGSSVTRKEATCTPPKLLPAVHLAPRAPQPRGAYVFTQPLLKKNLFLGS